MIPHAITDSGLVFFARGRPYQVAKDHSAFDCCLEALTHADRLRVEGPDGEAESLEDLLIGFLDFTGSIQRTSSGRIDFRSDALHVDGQPIGHDDAWVPALHKDRKLARILLIQEGDRVSIEGDEDCPDGVHVISGIDLSDTERTLYVEDDEAGFYGYVSNNSVKEVISHDVSS